MILLTKQGKNIEVPDLFAFSGGVWSFPLYGEETYIDPVDDEELYLSFYDAADMGRDSTDNRNDGTATDVTQTTGPFDKAGSFNGVSSDISISPFEIFNGAFSFSCNINLDTLTGDSTIFGQTNYSVRFRVEAAGNIKVFLINAGGLTGYATANGLITTGTDYNIQITYNNTTSYLNVYINNVNVLSTDTGKGSLVLDLTHDFNIGSYAGVSEYFDGIISDFRIFDRVLTDAERTALYLNNGWNTWYWQGVTNSTLEIIGAVFNGVILTPTFSTGDCEVLEASFFWDDADGIIYIHWPDSWGDWAVGRALATISELIAGYASKYNPITKNYYDGLFYDPIITGASGFDINVDPLKLGLIAFDESALTLANQGGRFDQLSDKDSVGAAIQLFYLDEEETEITRDDQVSTGTMYGYKNNRSDIKIKIIENRLYKNNPVCPNTITLDDYANAGGAVGKFIPVAWGKIRRGIAVLINEDSLTAAGTETAILLVADPDLGSILAIDAVYDETGEALVGALTVDLDACTVSFSKTAGVSPSTLNNYTWEGQGYDITGTYNNGLDIIVNAFEALASIPYLESTYNRTEWEIETLANSQSVGVSVQSDKGIIEEILEPILTSLQGVVIVEGDGRLTYKSRDTTALIERTFEAYEQTIEPTLGEDPEETISELLITYSPDFTDPEEKNLSYLYTDEGPRVLADYGINTREPISPLETVLTELADVEALALEVMDVSGYTQTISTFEVVTIDKALTVFTLLGLDVGRHDTPLLYYGEILKIAPDYINNKSKITLREFSNEPNLPLYHAGRLFGASMAGTIFPGYTRIRESI